MASILLKAVKQSPLSYRALAREAKVSSASVSLFVTGRRTLTLVNASKLAKVLGLHLTPIKERGK